MIILVPQKGKSFWLPSRYLQFIEYQMEELELFKDYVLYDSVAWMNVINYYNPIEKYDKTQAKLKAQLDEAYENEKKLCILTTDEIVVDLCRELVIDSVKEDDNWLVNFHIERNAKLQLTDFVIDGQYEVKKDSPYIPQEAWDNVVVGMYVLARLICKFKEK